jgi:hypothetical protein
MTLRIWFDADNAPHVLVMKPIAGEMEKRGHKVFFTARDRSSTCELLDMYGLDYIKVGKPFGKNLIRKTIGTMGRAVRLAMKMRNKNIDLSFGHSSRSLPIASGILGIPSITMYDYEWINPTIYNLFCKKILLPDVITDSRCREAGIDTSRVEYYPGLKENLYLNNIEPDRSIKSDLNLREDKIRVLLRPPATTAHYHNPEAEEILKGILHYLLNNPEVQLIWLPRLDEQKSMVAGEHEAEVIIPEKVYPGPQLALACDLVIGGGGTMTREAAVLGVPSISFFKGKRGGIDSLLEKQGRLNFINNTEMTESVLNNTIEQERHAPQPEVPILAKIVDTLEKYDQRS